MQPTFRRPRVITQQGLWARMLGRHSSAAGPKPLDRLDSTTLAGRLPDGFTARFEVTVGGASLPCVIAGQRGVFVVDTVKDGGPDLALGTAAMKMSHAADARVQPLYLAAGLTEAGLTLHGVEVVGIDGLRSYLLASTDGRLDWASFKRVHALLDRAA